MPETRYTPLRARHEALGAAFTDFGGWMMPVRYSSDLAEHHAVRTAAGLFDISHMAEIMVTGSDAALALDYALAGVISSMRVGKAKYSLVLTESGGILDDVIVYRLADDRFLVIANAGNRTAVVRALRERAGRRAGEVEVVDTTDAMSLIAVQGPAAQSILEATPQITDIEPALSELGYYAWADASFEGIPALIARTGYTGENGYEILVPNDRAEALWDALLAAGAPFSLVPAGLAARDTLRLEAGMPLYGHELSLDTTPAQAGLGRVVGSDKPDFVGKTAVSRIGDAEAPVLVGLASEGKRAGRSGYEVFEGELRVGEITSGALSPTLGHPISMAFVSPTASARGTELFIDVRGTRIPATVTALPFYRRTP